MAFVLGLPGGRTPGDVHGYDPGGRAVPLLAAGLMTVLAGWALVREVRAAPGEGFGPLALVAAYAVLAVAFVAVLRSVGFVIGAALLTFGLIALNAHAAGQPLARAALVLGAVATLVAAAALDALVGWLVRAASGVGREVGWTLLQAPHGRAFVAAAAVTVLLILVIRWLPETPAKAPVLVAVGLASGVFVVFRLLFQVPLPGGPWGL